MSTEYDKEKNVLKAERLVREAADDGAQIICLQELFHTIYFPYELEPRHLDLAEPLNGPLWIPCANWPVKPARS